jgi:hypothetical protein
LHLKALRNEPVSIYGEEQYREWVIYRTLCCDTQVLYMVNGGCFIISAGEEIHLKWLKYPPESSEKNRSLVKVADRRVMTGGYALNVDRFSIFPGGDAVIV